MGAFSENRRSFGGQTLNVTMMSESQLLGEAALDPWDYVDGLNVLLDRAFKDPSFVHIRLIDEYGTTVFNRMQLKEVLPELKRLLEFTTSVHEVEMLEEVLEVAQQVEDAVHTFLVFLGD
ncbi:MAG TPA: hypothetical protein VEU29_02455 [Actinomycetota bacterium]|nr:hypothetical protein [Actinomycetota bacterium]